MMNRFHGAVAIAACALSLLSLEACRKDCTCPTAPATNNDTTHTSAQIVPFAWEQQYSPITTTLISVAMVDALTATAVGSLGVIIHTTDGGATWVQQQSSARDDLYGVSFIDRSTGVVLGGSSILYTSDGGATWNNASWPGGCAIRNVQLLPGGVGYAVGNQDLGGHFRGHIYRTTNFGRTWAELALPPEVTGLYGVQFLDSNVGTVSSRDGQIVHTNDGGATWTLQQTGTTYFIHGIFFTSPTTGTAVGGAQGGPVGTILRTTNGGNTWVPQTPAGANVFLYRICFTSQKHAITAGYNGRILRTADAGATWVDNSIATANRVIGLSFINDSTGIAVGDAGMIMHVKH
jgi:photosystem II stability/assembly factor-like uncharacterized protein